MVFGIRKIVVGYTEMIPHGEHVTWLNAALRDSAQEIYILCEEDINIGQVRLVTEDDTATDSYNSIDAAYRAQEYGKTILQPLVENLCAKQRKPNVLRGYVKKKNIVL